MPIAAAGIGAAASIGGSILSAKSNKKAINKATDAQVQVAAQNNALAREIYGKNEGYLNPYVQRGNAAGGAINALLGLGSGVSPQMTGGGAQQVPVGSVTNGAGQPVNAFQQQLQNRNPGFAEAIFGGGWLDGANELNGGYQTIGNGAVTTATPTPTPAATTPQQDYNQAFQNYQNSTGYQFRMGQGMNALNSGYAARGLLHSGAAQKAALQYGQNIGSAEFGNYLGYLSNQQGVGLSGASALAGVGQNYVNSVTANNNNSADAISNGALMKGRNNANMWGGIAGGIGSIFGGSSFGGF